MSVYVKNLRNEPLMPCSEQKARVLVKQGKAKVVEIKPFTIQLLIATGESKQEITLGIDSGYNRIAKKTPSACGGDELAGYFQKNT